MKISVVIHTYNAEEFLDRVLQSVKAFDEIVICDMYSTDRTIEIAESHNCKIIFHENTGVPEPARNYAMQSATHPWVFVVDADEYIPQTLVDYLYEQIKRDDCPTGIRIPRKNYLMGRFMHAAYPDYILRFFRKDKVDWPPVMHSNPEVDGTVYTIPKSKKELAFVHLSNQSISFTVNKTNRYTSLEAIRRKNKKYGYLAIMFEPIVPFLRCYLFKGGFRDGKPGLIWAMQYAFYKFITIAKVIESKVTDEDMDSDLKQK